MSDSTDAAAPPPTPDLGDDALADPSGPVVPPGDDGENGPTNDGSGGLVRSSGIVAAGTLASRVTGLARTMLIGVVLGATALGDGYTLANTTPNVIYDLLLGGILSATLVPVLVSNRERDDQRGTDAVLTVATVALLVITVVALVLAPAIIALYTTFSGVSGAEPSAADTQLATDLLRLFVPQILFYGLTTLGSALLNAHRRFAAAAFAPVVNNVAMILVLIVAARMVGDQLTAEEVLADPALLLLLGLGTTAGIAAMAIVLWPAIRRAGIRTRIAFDWGNPSVRKVARLSGWTLGYAFVNQIAIFVTNSLAYGQDGGVLVWGIAYQFFQLPYGVFTVSIMTAFTPELASLDGRGERGRFTERFLFGLRLIMVVVVPATVGFVLLARPMVKSLLEYRNFDAAAVDLTAPTVAAFGWGIIGFSVYLYTLRAFYAMKDTRTPFLVNVVENLINVALAFVLVTDLVTPGGFGVEGLAWAWSGAYTIAAVMALAVLHRRLGTFGPAAAAAGSAIGRIAVAGVAMGAAVWVAVRALEGSDPSPWLLGGVGAIVGLAVYVALTVALRVPEIRDLTKVVLRRA